MGNKVSIEKYLKKQKSEHLAPRLKSLIKTLITEQNYSNTEGLISLLEDIISIRTMKIKSKVEKNQSSGSNIGQSINLPRLFSLLGNKNSGSEKDEQKDEKKVEDPKENLIEELIIAEPIITRLRGFINLLSSMVKEKRRIAGADSDAAQVVIDKAQDRNAEFYDNPESRPKNDEQELNQIWEIFARF